MSNPESITINGLVPIRGRSQSENLVVSDTSDTEYLFDSIYLPSANVFTMQAYWPDVSNKYLVQNWNSAYPGLEWTQPFYAYGANGPTLYELPQAPSGMTIGSKMVRDPVTGFYKFDQFYGVLKWENPTTGRHRIVVRATDQLGQTVHWQFNLFVDPARNFFMALNATGTGLGTSPSNYASWTSTILGQSTESPSKNKVLRIKGDTYPTNAGLRPNKDYTAVSWTAMPAQTPVFLQKFNLGSDDLHFHNIKFEGVGTSDFGVINGQGLQHRIGVWGVEFNECYMVGSAGGNQSCVGFNKTGHGTQGRDRIFVADCIFRNSETIHGTDYYTVANNALIRNRLVITNGATEMASSWLFPKLQSSGEIMFNHADIPGITLTSDSIIQLTSGWEPAWSISYDINHRCEHNFVRTGGANILHAGNDNDSVLPELPENVISFYVKRNTFVGGYAGADFFTSTDPRTRREAYFESNIAISNSGGGVGGITKGTSTHTDWFFNTGTNIAGNMAALPTLLDANYAPLDTAKYGKTGKEIWRPE